MSSVDDSVPTPTTASSSVKRERSASPAEEQPGRDAKRANLGEMTTETKDREPNVEELADRKAVIEESVEATPAPEEPSSTNGNQESHPITQDPVALEQPSDSNGTERQDLQLTTETQGSASRYVFPTR